MNPGLYPKMKYEAYREIPAMNYSTLKHMKRSALSYRWNLDNPPESTPSQLLGIAAHICILEPNRTGDFVVWPGGRRYGKEWDLFRLVNADKQILTIEERDRAAGIGAAVRTCKAAKKYLADGESEVSMVWKDKATRWRFKSRLDWLTDVDGPVIVDLKSTRDCQPWRFGNDAYKLGYYLQSAMHSDGYYTLFSRLPKVVTIAVESKPPYECAVYVVPEDVLQQGHDDYMRLAQQVKECEHTGVWGPAMEEESNLSLPSYAYGDEVDDLTDLELVL